MMMWTRRAGVALGVGGLAVGLLTVAPRTAPEAQAANTVSAKKLLQQLPVTVERSSGYDRDDWKHWIDADRDGCDTREEVLIAEAKGKASTSVGCSVSGRWVSKYDRAKTTNPVHVRHRPHGPAGRSAPVRWAELERRHETAVRQRLVQSIADRGVRVQQPQQVRSRPRPVVADHHPVPVRVRP